MRGVSRFIFACFLLCALLWFPVQHTAENTPADGYHNYAALSKALQQLAQNSPKVMKLTSIGKTLKGREGVSKLGITTDAMGGQLYDIASNGNVVLLVQSVPMIMSALKPDASHRWGVRFDSVSAGSIDR